MSRIDAVFHLIQEIGDLLRSQVAADGLQGSASAQDIAGLAEPGDRMSSVLQYVGCQSQDSSNAYETVGSGWTEPAPQFPADTGAKANLEQAILFRRGQCRASSPERHTL